jgi:streptogramin lyase
MKTERYSRYERGYGSAVKVIGALLGLTLSLLSCHSGGGSGSVSPPPEASPQLERQAVQGLLELYQTALLREDIDRLQLLLHESGGGMGQRCSLSATAGTFLEAITDLFRRSTVLDLQLTEVVMQTAAEPFTVSFRETFSLEDPFTLEQRACSVRTTWHLVRQTSPGGSVTILIGTVTQTGPQFQATTRGQLQAGVPARIEVRETSGTLAMAGVGVEVPDTGALTTLVAEKGGFVGSFTPPTRSKPQALRVRVRGAQGEEVIFPHRYRLRVPGEGAVERVAGTEMTPLFAVAVAPDGTAWVGGEARASGAVGTIFRVAADGQTILRHEQPILERLPEESVSRIEDLVIDRLGRVHLLFIARIRGEGGASGGVIRNADIVFDPRFPDLFCQTVDVRSANYPFRGQGQPSPSTRMLAAGGGDVWLFGSDGGVARVADAFREGQCPAGGAEVGYDPVFRRDESGLLSNTVPALAERADGALWFGTAFGLAHLRGGRFTPVPFHPTLSLRGDVATLEAFFQAVADAILAAQPVSTVSIGGVSFVDRFGSPLVKGDLIFSLAEDARGRLWVGTLGEGIRRIEESAGALRETLHFTREAGLGGSLVVAMAVGPDGTIWAATEEGVSRIREHNGEITVTNFSASDGLALPVRDVAVGGDGVPWLATGGGLFRIISAVGAVRGVVRDVAGRPVAGAEVRILGTPFRTVTDAEGRFVLVNLPPGTYQLLIDGSVVAGGPFTATVREVAITAGAEPAPVEVVIVPRPLAAGLKIVSGDHQTGPAGRPLPSPLVVEVEDRQGHGLAGVPVAFRVTAGGGILMSEVSVTDVGGLATNTLTPTVADSVVQVIAGADGLTVAFTATAVGAAGAARLIKVAGDNQVIGPEEVLPTPLVVLLEDEFGKPVPNVEVTAEIIQGDAQFVDVTTPPEALAESGTAPLQTSLGRTATAVTDREGKAAFRLQVGTTQGEVIVEVSAPQVEPVQFKTLVGFATPFDIAVEANGRLLVVDAALQALIRVNPANGERTPVSGVLDLDLNPNTADALIGGGPPFVFPRGVSIDADGTFVVADAGALAIVRVDPVTGDRVPISGRGRGAGPTFQDPTDVAVEREGTLVVTDDLRRAIIRVDPASGERRIISGADPDKRRLVGAGPPFVFPASLAVEADGNLVVTDAGFGGLMAVLRVDRATGDRKIISGVDPETGTLIGSGPNFLNPVGIGIGADGLLVISDNLLDAVVLVDPVSGDRLVVSGFDPDAGVRIGSGPRLTRPQGLAVAADGALFVADWGLSGVIRVDPTTGDRAIVSRVNLGSGPPLADPRGIVVAPDGSFLVAENDLNAVLRVDSETGDRTMLSGSDFDTDALIGGGPLLEFPVALAIEADGNLVVVDAASSVSSSGLRAVVRLDPIRGHRSILSDANTGGGPPFELPLSVAIETDGNLVVVDAGLKAIVRVHPVSGDRTVVSGGPDGIGGGPPFTSPRDLAIERDGRIVVLDGNRVLRVDPGNGDRSLVSVGEPLSAILGFAPTALAIEASGHLLVINYLDEEVERVDPVNGTRTVVSGPQQGSGPPFGDPQDIAVKPDGTLVVLDGPFGLKAVIEVDPISGDRTIISR